MCGGCCGSAFTMFCCLVWPLSWLEGYKSVWFRWLQRPFKGINEYFIKNDFWLGILDYLYNNERKTRCFQKNNICFPYVEDLDWLKAYKCVFYLSHFQLSIVHLRNLKALDWLQMSHFLRFFFQIKIPSIDTRKPYTFDWFKFSRRFFQWSTAFLFGLRVLRSLSKLFRLSGL